MTTIKSAKVTKDGIVVPVSVEVCITDGIGIHLVGPDQAVKESLLRVVTAIQQPGYKFPGKKVVINIAPADLRKSGVGYDLPIALGILAESGQIRIPEHILENGIFYGELGICGDIFEVGDEETIITEMRHSDDSNVVITSVTACKKVLSHYGLVGFTSLAWLLRFMGN